MTISYPITPPSTPGHSSIEWIMESAAAISQSPYSFKSQTQKHSGDRWAISVALPPMDRATAAPWFAFFGKLRGKYGTFYYGSYLQGAVRGLGGGTPLVNGAGQVGYTLAVDGCTNSAAFLKEGDLFSIGSSVYQNLTDVSANGSGQCTLDVFPRLREHADNSALDLTYAKGVWRMRENQASFVEGSNKLMMLSFVAEEAL